MKSLVGVCVLSATAAAAPSAWVQEIVDYDLYVDTGVELFARPDGLVLFGAPGHMAHASWFVRGANGWSEAEDLGKENLGATVDKAGVRWWVSFDDDAVILRHDKVAETIVKDHDSRFDRVRLTFDDAGVPHVCISGQTLDRRTSAKLRYATRGKKGWIVETVPGEAFRCTIAVADDGIVHIGTDTGIARRTGTWKTEALGGSTAVVRGPDGRIVAVTAKGPSLLVTRDGKATPLAEIEGWFQQAIAIDSKGRVHVAVERRDKQGLGEIHYAVEGTPGTQLVAKSDAQVGIAIATDAANEPHIVFGNMWQQTQNKTIRYARKRTPKDAAADIVQDVEGIVTTCGRAISDELAGSSRQNLRDFRMCEQLKALKLTPAELEKRCERDPGACVLAAALVGSPRSRTMVIGFELAHENCGPKKRCVFAYRSESEFGQWVVPAKTGTDDVRALKLLRSACDRGVRGACLQITLAENPNDADALVKHCSAGVPLACALALHLKPSKDAAIRTSLEAACKTATTSVACNALAYFLDSNKLPGSAKHHARACLLGDTTSCGMLIGRAAPPKGLDPDTLQQLFEERCGNGDGDVCLAYANALERGWSLKRDRAKAKEMLTKGCDARSEAACKKLGGKPPAMP